MTRFAGISCLCRWFPWQIAPGALARADQGVEAKERVELGRSASDEMREADGPGPAT
jgi:hypothetical protein